jgi:hypothetical protein
MSRMVTVCFFSVLVACKAGGALNWSSSGGTSPSSGGAPLSGESTSAAPVRVADASSPTTSSPSSSPTYDKAAREREQSEIGNSLEKASAWFQKYEPARIKAACGVDVKLSVDFASFANDAGKPTAYHLTTESYCGNIVDTIVSVCESPTGKAAMHALRAVQCERLEGKATKGGTKILKSASTKHAYQFENGKLTLKLGGTVYKPDFGNDLTAVMWPQVPWQKQVDEYLPWLNKKVGDWTEDKEGVELTVDVDPKGFATVDYIESHYFCGGDGNSLRTDATRGKLYLFLDLLYKTTPKGKQILKRVKHVTCSATPDINGKAPEIVGDRLIFYARVLREDHFRASFYAPTGQRFPENDVYFAYALFRKAQHLGGECPWQTDGDKDPERDRLCPEK